MIEGFDIERLRNEINISPLEVYDKCNYICSNLWNELSKKDKVEILLIKVKNLWKLKYYEEGLVCCEEAYNLVETKKQLCEIYIIHSVVEKAIGNYLEAGDLNFKALKIAKEINDWKLIRRIYNNIGAIYLILEDYDEAYEYCLKTEELDSIYGEEVIEGITTLHESLSKIYAGRGEYKKALVEIDKMIMYSRRNYHKINEATGFFGKAMILKKSGDYNEALEIFAKAKKMLNELNIASEDLIIIMEEIKCYYELGDISSAKKLMEDLEYYIKSDEMNNFIDYMNLLIKISPDSIKDNSIKVVIKNMINEHYKLKENKREFIIRSLNELRDKDRLEIKNEHIENRNKTLEIEKNKVKKINENMKLIFEIGKSIISLNEEEKLIGLLYDKIKLLVNIDAVGILLVNDNKIDKACFMNDKKIFTITEDLNTKKTMSYSVFNNKLHWFLSNSIKSDFLDILPDMKSVLILHLVYDGKINGILNLQKKCEDGFNEDILDNIKELAPFISIAINNIKIYEELDSKIWKLESLCKRNFLI